MYIVIAFIVNILALWILSHFPVLELIIGAIGLILFGYAAGGIKGAIITLVILVLLIKIVLWASKDNEKKEEQEKQKQAAQNAATAKMLAERRAMIDRAIARSREQDK